MVAPTQFPLQEEAEKRGLSIEYNKRIGWSITQPTKQLRSLCAREHWIGKLDHASYVDGKRSGREKSHQHRKMYAPAAVCPSAPKKMST